MERRKRCQFLRRLLVSLLFASLLTTSSLSISTFSIVAPEAMTVSNVFDPTGWTKKRNVTIDNSANSQDLGNYQVALSIVFSAAMKPDFSDLRFIDSTGGEIPYWLESKQNGVSASVFVKVPFIPANSMTSITIFYGNPSATSTSNGHSTFVFFDDFEYADDPENHGWIQHYPTFAVNDKHATTDTAYFRTGSRSLFTKGVNTAGTHDDDRALAKYDLPLRNNLVFEGQFFHNGTAGMIEHIMIQTNGNFSSYTVGASTPDGLSGRIPGAETQYLRRYTPVEPCCGTVTGLSFVANQWNSFKMVKSSSSFQGFVLGQQVGPTVSDTTDVSQIFIGGGSSADGPDGQPWWFDDVRIRKFTGPEPVATIGPESEVVAHWNRWYGGPSDDFAISHVQTADGGYAIAGYTRSFGAGSYDFWLVKTDVMGNVEWNRAYGGTGDEYAYSVVQTAEGGYALIGYTYSFGAGSEDFWLVKTDAMGNMEWNHTYGGISRDFGLSVAVAAEGGYALAGSTSSFGAGLWDFWLVKTDASGSIEWNRTYGGPLSEYMPGTEPMAQRVDGGYALAGQTYSFGAGLSDAWLVVTDSGGNVQWNQTYGGPDDDLVYSLARTSDGGFALAGRTIFRGGDNTWLIKTDLMGTMEWIQTYQVIDLVYSIVQTTDGGYALGGVVYDGTYDAALAKIDGLGNIQWSRLYGGVGNDEVTSLVQTGDGGYALAGGAIPNSLRGGCQTLDVFEEPYDAWLVKTDTSGKMYDIETIRMLMSSSVSRSFAYSGIVAQPIQICVWLNNIGSDSQITVKARANTTFLGSVTVTVGQSQLLLVRLNGTTTSLAVGNYEIYLEVDSLPGEANIANNISIMDGVFQVRKAGDVNGDCAVNFIDLGRIGASFLKSSGQAGFDPDADINFDDAVNFLDLGIVGSNFLNSCG